MGSFTKNNRIDKGSIIFLFIDSNALNGGFVSAKVRPKLNTKLLIALGSNPLLRIADRVSRRGSSQLVIAPSSNNCLIFLLETGMFSNSSLENPRTNGFLNFNLSSTDRYNVLRSSYSLVLNAWLTPSRLSSTGAAKS